MPGDPAAIMIGKLRRANGGRELSPQLIQSIYDLLGADKNTPLWDQYLGYWTRLLHGDLGLSSTRYPYPVAELILNALPWTLFMVGLATVISFVLGIVGGAWVGWRRGTWLDQLVPATALLQSIPYFWLALVPPIELITMVSAGRTRAAARRPRRPSSIRVRTGSRTGRRRPRSAASPA